MTFTLDASNHVDLVDGRFRGTEAEAALAKAAMIEAIGAMCAKPAGEPLVVHFHGGLVSRRSAAAMAAELGPVYGGAGGQPFFFVWNSDVKTTLWESLDEIPKEEAFQRLLKKVAQWVGSKLLDDAKPAGARGITIEAPVSVGDVPDDPQELEQFLAGHAQQLEASGRPPTDLSKYQSAQIEKDLSADAGLRHESAAISNGIPAGGGLVEAPSRGFGGRTSHQTRMSPTALDELAKSRAEGEKSLGVSLFLARKALVIVTRVVRRFAAKRDHGVYTTIVEEILRELYVDTAGQLVWSMMKQDTLDSFQDAGAGAAFLNALANAWTPGRRLVLVGHSTGAIYITHMLASLRQLAPAFRPALEVVFLAPAITFDLLAHGAEDYRALAAKFRVFSLFDAVERSYWEVPIYRGSLLYIVSGLFENEPDTPIVGMERYWTAPYETPAIANVRELVAEDCRIWSRTDPAALVGRRSASGRHGDFDNDADCKASLAEIVRHGL